MLCILFEVMETRQARKKQRSAKKQKEPLAIKHKEYLTLLSKTKNNSRRQKLIEAADSGEISAVSECIRNLVEGNVPLNKSQLRSLRRYKRTLRTLAKKCGGVKKKRKLLRQKGGFLSTLIPIALSAVTSLLGGLVKG